MLNVNIFLLHGDIDKSQVNILMLHVDIIYLTYRGRSMPPWQRYVTIQNNMNIKKNYTLVPCTDKWNHDGSFVDPSER